MDIQSLIRLAHQADLEGNYKVADKLTERAIREAQWYRNIGRNIGDFLGNMNVGRGARDNANQSLNFMGGNANAGGGGQVQQMVDAAAEAVSNVKVKNKTNPQIATTYVPYIVTMPDGRQLSTKGNMNEIMSVIDQLPEDVQKEVKRRGAGIGNLKSKVNVDTEAEAKAVGNASSTGGDASSGLSGGITKQDRFKSHNITGITGPAAVGLAGVVAALGGLGMYLMNGKVVDQRGNPVPPDRIPDDIKKRLPQDFKANQLAERSQANQMQDAQMAQNFIQMRKGLPNFTTAQDFFYAAQAAGMTPGQMNQVAALAKAEGFRDKTPMMN